MVLKGKLRGDVVFGVQIRRGMEAKFKVEGVEITVFRFSREK